ncbi:hypothetical protein DOY81_015122 [Sarcophaga bullata]|nr:hypothetical protein DOY81_015122 [Sarcophaga bullata]
MCTPNVLSTDGEESHRAPSNVQCPDDTIAHERTSPQGHYHSSRKTRLNGHSNGNSNGNSNGHYNHSVVDGGGPRALSNPPPNRLPPRAPSALSYDHGVMPAVIYTRYSHRPPSRAPRSVYSVASTAKTGRSARSTTKRGAKIETMSAPNPFCPNVKGVCCLMLLLNLGIILVTLGFVIVVQLYEPFYVWVLGIIFLIFGFLTLIGCMIYCVYVCRDAKTPSQVDSIGQ